MCANIGDGTVRRKDLGPLATPPPLDIDEDPLELTPTDRLLQTNTRQEKNYVFVTRSEQ